MDFFSQNQEPNPISFFQDNTKIEGVNNGNGDDPSLKYRYDRSMQSSKSLIFFHVNYYIRFLAGLVFLLVLFDWGNLVSAQEGHQEVKAAESEKIVIDMESYVFTPTEVTVVNGRPLTIILRNQSFLVPHNFILDDPHGVRLLDADISSGESQTHVVTLNEPGIYPFYCDKQLLFFPTHREEGMEGRFIVH